MKVINNTEPIMTIQQILRNRRRDLKLTQTEVAYKMGVSTMQLSYLERNTRELKVKHLIQWADKLGLEVKITFDFKGGEK